MSALSYDVLSENHTLMTEFKKTDSYKKKIKADEAYATAFQNAYANVVTALDKGEDITNFFLAIPDRKLAQSFASDSLEVLPWIYNLNPKLWTGRIDAKHDIAYIGFNGLTKSLANLAILNALNDQVMPYDLWHQPTLELDTALYSDVIELIHKNLQSVTGGYMADIMADVKILHGLDSAWDLKTLLSLSNKLGIKGTWQSTST